MSKNDEKEYFKMNENEKNVDRESNECDCQTRNSKNSIFCQLNASNTLYVVYRPRTTKEGKEERQTKPSNESFRLVIIDRNERKRERKERETGFFFFFHSFKFYA